MATTGSATRTAATQGSPQPAASQYRPEIHGLRGMAIALVVAYHLWGAGRVSGGVDVFLMISAFLMTSSFARKGMAFDIIDFLVNRFRRLIPSAAVVIASVLAAGWILLPKARWYNLLQNAADSILYRQNFALMAASVNYTAADRSGTSPLQHFWSLSLQGQIFIIWPVLMLGCMALFRATGFPIRRSLAIVLTVLTVASFGYAWYAVHTSPVTAYFSLGARIWEFSLASLLALVPVPRLPSPVAALLGWVGVVAIVTGGLVVGREPFPGPAALWPSLAAAAVVFAGSSTQRYHASYWLATKPVTWLGDRAYTLYLWHWPILMFWLTLSHANTPGIVGSIVVISLALILADLTTRSVERGFNRLPLLGHKRWGIAIITFFLVAGLAVSQLVPLLQQRTEQQAQKAPAGAGAKVVTPGAPVPTPQSGPYKPADTLVGDDWPPPLPVCQPETNAKLPDSGGCGELLANGTPTKKVLVVGDSHANQWLGAIEPMAREYNWHLVGAPRGACRLTLENPLSDPGCLNYTRGVVDFAISWRPDFVFTVGTRAQPSGPEQAVETYAEAMRPVVEAGIPVISMRDNPRFTLRIPECVQTNGPTSPLCQRPRSEKLAPVSPLLALEASPGMLSMDMSDYICPATMCPPVIGNVYVYMDDNHLSRTYVATLREEFEAQLWRVIPR